MSPHVNSDERHVSGFFGRSLLQVITFNCTLGALSRSARLGKGRKLGLYCDQILHPKSPTPPNAGCPGGSRLRLYCQALKTKGILKGFCWW